MNQLMQKLVGVVLILASSVAVVYAQSSPQPLGDTRPSVVSKSKSAVNKSGKINRVMQHQQAGVLVEEFAFWIKDFKLDHQNETNTLNISLSYRYVVNIANSDYPDFRLLAKDVETFLTNYPNEGDYWEIVNKNLTQLLMNKYPALLSVTSELKADPTRLDPYLRSSRVTRERSNRKRM